MAGQPVGFDIYVVYPTEEKNYEAPAFVVEAGTKLTLKTYFRIEPTLPRMIRRGIKTALGEETASLEYHFQDLETGAMVNMESVRQSVPDPIDPTKTKKLVVVPVTAADAANPVLHPALQNAPDGEYFVSGETEIETGESESGKMLCPPKDHPQSGTWRVLTHVHGGIDSDVTAFDDNLLINVIT